jgi:hypothetical protein
MLGAVLVALLILCAAPTRGAEAAPHRARAAKHATSKHAAAKPLKAKRKPAGSQTKSSGAEVADEPKPAPEPTPEPKVEQAPTRPAMQGAAVTQAEDPEDPPKRQRR